ncbi:unnamed protein product, partial [Closterium sp. Naga37s-1]
PHVSPLNAPCFPRAAPMFPPCIPHVSPLNAPCFPPAGPLPHFPPLQAPCFPPAGPTPHVSPLQAPCFPAAGPMFPPCRPHPHVSKAGWLGALCMKAPSSVWSAQQQRNLTALTLLLAFPCHILASLHPLRLPRMASPMFNPCYPHILPLFAPRLGAE